MNENKTAQIKKIVAKIDTEKIASYPQHSESKTLRQIIGYSKRILDNDEKTFKLAVKIAYLLDVIVNINKYVNKEEEKKHWLKISEELFENTVGLRDENNLK